MYLLYVLAFFVSVQFIPQVLAQSEYSRLEKRINELEASLDDVELNQALQKFHMSGSFVNHAESFAAVRKGTASYGDERSNQNQNLTAIGTRIALNFDYTVSKTMSVYSTLSMNKFWNIADREGRSDEGSNIESAQGGYNYTGDNAHFDVAYLSYKPENSPWSFAIGRLTTNGGPPLNQHDGLERTGTYPAKLYNVIFDGVGGIYNFSDFLPKNQSIKMRIFYTPFFSIDKDYRDRQAIDPDTQKEKVDSRADFFTLLTEYRVKKVLGASHLDVFHGVYNLEDYYEKNFQVPNDGIANYIGVTTNTLYFGLNNFLQDGFNLSFSNTYTILKAKGSKTNYGNSYLFGVNYQFDNKFNARDILGVEYIKSDENRLPSDGTTPYIGDFYDIVNGNGLHLFYTIPVGNTHVIRIGQINYSEGESTLFKREYEANISSTYARWKVFF